ncbi:LacI family DNA-binding transcriptional regulator [Acutalibacter caecimuris]|uniref:LacI family DNA-binding transcriptional regulator n=1 Tax=Acutalibacter caecimuris TaxID=3093657 RepID=UPI002AC8C3F0|nr:LacI family DNA-binding transcriptional regulator [Acutalibacter sp. M00118]
MKASVRSISEMTGFSPATVSNALNNKRGVSRETAEKILRAAREAGYFDGPGLQRLRLVVYQADGAVVNDSPFFARLMAGVEAECRRLKLELITCHLQKGAPDYDARLAELLEDSGAALLLLATEMEAGEAARFRKAAGPVVVLDNWYEGLPFSAVLIDNTDGAFEAVSYLIGQGHSRIGHLQGKGQIKNFYYRRQGYLRAMAEHGLPVEPRYTVPLSTGMEQARADMAAWLASGAELPTAFFADNDMIALGAMRALEQAGRQVPGEVSVVGFDDLPFCAISSPPLTTVRVFNYEMGQAAVRRLLEIAGDGGGYRTKVQVTSAFVCRDSVRDLRDQGKAPG